MGRLQLHLTAVLGVDIRDLGTGQVTDDDAVPVAVEERLALRVLVQHYGLPPLCPGQTGEGPPVGDSLSSSHRSDGLAALQYCTVSGVILILSVLLSLIHNRLEEHKNHNNLL